MPNLNSTYQGAASAATGTVLGTAGQNIELFKIIVGTPVSSGNIYIFDETNPGVISNTSGLVAKYTLASNATNTAPFVIDFTDGNGSGTILRSGGSFFTDQTMNVTFLWCVSQEQN